MRGKWCFFEDFPSYVHLLSAAVSGLIDRLTLLPTGHNVEMLSCTPGLPTLPTPTNTNITHTWQYYYSILMLVDALAVVGVDIDVLMLMKLIDTMCHVRQCSCVCEQFAVFSLY